MKKSFLAAVIVFGLSVTTSAQDPQSTKELKACACHEADTTRDWDLVLIYRDKIDGALSKVTFSRFDSTRRYECSLEIHNLIKNEICPKPADEKTADAENSNIKTLGNICVIVKDKVRGDTNNLMADFFGPGSKTVYKIYVGDEEKYSFSSASAAKTALKSLVKQGVCKT